MDGKSNCYFNFAEVIYIAFSDKALSASGHKDFNTIWKW